MASVAPASLSTRGPLRNVATNLVVVAWEVTRACGRACRHCRPDTRPRPMIGEPDHDEGMPRACAGKVRGHHARTDRRRPAAAGRDLVDVATEAHARGLRVTPGRLRELADAGVECVAISIDGTTAEAHDTMRGRRGSFDRSRRIVGWAREAGTGTQVNTTVTRYSAGDLERMAQLVADLDTDMWSVFFLVPVGRAPGIDMLDADGHEAALHRLAEMSEHVPFRLKVTEAPQYPRILMQTGRSAHMPPAVNGGRGFMFISHDGRISPNGFLPLVASDVRRDDPVEVYRMAPVFRDLRDTAKLQGKCGICEYRSVCGGGCAHPERWAARRRRAAPRGGGLAGHRAARSFLGRHAPGVGAHHPVVGDLGARHSPAIAPAQPRRAFGEAVQQLRLPRDVRRRPDLARAGMWAGDARGRPLVPPDRSRDRGSGGVTDVLVVMNRDETRQGLLRLCQASLGGEVAIDA